MFRSEATASFASANASNCTRVLKYGYQQNPSNVGMTLPIVILTKNVLFRNYSTFAYLLWVHISNINMHIYIASAHGDELSSGCVHTHIITHAWAEYGT